mgnify:CR=1 FL=1
MKLKTSLLITVATGTFLCASSVVSYAGTSTPDTMGLFRKKKKTESNDSIKSKNEYEKLTGDNKELMIIPGANHVDLYDSPTAIPFEKLKSFFEEYLK